MPFTATLIVLEVTGFINALYLTYKHYKKAPLVCPINHDCNAVVQSKWGKTFGIPNAVLGVFFYVSMLGLGLISIINPDLIPSATLYLLIGASSGLAFSAYLTWLQKYVIKDYCFYCLISAGISVLLFINTLILYR